ncbi:hypothetical protein Rhopal_005051-T1 [Rhodotorula paludigena]|uniref:Proteophosphoglycan ppg4 n=1 Tax=Rhodotorula paludigena TaxID=86838 RepID=A0AAV5GPF1_9BASI|nr:hypothetical protein Rhopal_005051-T1 [Rhodotorula paludigena]
MSYILLPARRGAEEARRPPTSAAALGEPVDFNPLSSLVHAQHARSGTNGLPRTSSGRDVRLVGFAASSSASNPSFGQDTLPLVGEEGRGNLARRVSEDTGPGVAKRHPADLRSSSVPTPEPGSGPATPRSARRTDARGGEDEATQLTPRGSGFSHASAGSTPRARQASGPSTLPALPSSTSSAARPLHTPPTLLSRNTSTVLSYSPPRSSPSRFARLDSSSSTFLDPRSALLSNDDDDDAHSSSQHSDALSLSSEENAWAGTLLPSGSSPPQSPLLAEIAARAARQPSLSAAAAAASGPGGVRESRLSEFDWAAAYADSRSPSLMHGFAPATAQRLGAEGTSQEGVASPPLPPLPVEAEEDGDEEDDAGRRGAAAAQEGAAAMGLGIEDVPPALPVKRKPSAPQLHVASADALHNPDRLAPTSLSGPTAQDAARPSSRASSHRSGARTPSPVPPRPPRRAASNLSLRSDAASASNKDEAELPATPVRAPASASTTPPSSPPPSASPDAAAASIHALVSAASVVAPAPAAAGASTLDAPLTVPRVRKAPQLGTTPNRRASMTSRRGGPAPSIPEKSARRTSALVQQKRLSVLDRGTGTGDGLGEEAGKTGKKGDKAPSAATSPLLGDDMSKRFSVPYSVSDFAAAYGRDSWAEYPSSESDYPPSASGHRLSHFRDAASVEASPRLPVPDNQADDATPAAPESAEAPSVAREDDTTIQPAALQPPAPPSPGSVSPAPSGAEVSDGVVRTGTPRSDAKARAAAFIADLKRARAKEASTDSLSSIDASRTTTDVPASLQVHPDSVVGPPVEPAQEDQEVLEIPPLPPSHGSSPALPSPPRDESPVRRTLRSGSIFTTTTRPSISTPTASPPLPPIDSKRPSDSSVGTLYIRRRSSQPANAPPLPSLPADLSSLSAAHRPLHRRRPLPPAIQVASELRKARTPRERGRIYAEKINELARERSRLDEWLGSVRTMNSAVGRSPEVPTSPFARNRAARQEGSTATFAPRGDGYRAKEIPHHTFSPKDLVPNNAPYPGVLGLAPSSSSNSLGKHSSYSAANSGQSGGKSFFSGLGVGRGSLGRRASKSHHQHPFASGAVSSSNAPSIRSTISGPVHLLSSTNTNLTSGPGSQPISGPRMPNPVPPGTRERASFDQHSPRGSSPSGSPSMSANPSRASFSYGSTPYGSASAATTMPISASVPSHLGASGNTDEAKLSRLQDILPQAMREDLVEALGKAGGDDVLAISVYLSSEAAKR